MSVLVVASVVALLDNLPRLGWLPRDAEYLHSLNLARLQRAAGSSISVVALGSSKTRYAIEYDQKFAKRLGALSASVAFTRVSTGAPTSSEVAAALDALQAMPPNLLLLEDDLLLVDRHRGLQAWLDRTRFNLRLLDPRVSDASSLPRGENFGRIHQRSDSECRLAKSPPGVRDYAEKAGRWTTSSPSDRAEHLRLLRALQQAGTRVVLLELPRSPVAERVVPVAFKEQSRQLRQGLLQQEGYLAWTPGTLAEASYCDQGHLNAQGRERYSEWLAKKLVDLLAHADV